MSARKARIKKSEDVKFITGPVCKRGHGGENNRYRGSRTCVQCTRDREFVRQEKEREGFVFGPIIYPPKNCLRDGSWPFGEVFEDNLLAARREPYWRDSMAYRRNVRAA